MPDLRKTKIICTLGPAAESEEMLRALIRGGMNAARFNFSHDNHSRHLARLNVLKRLREEEHLPIAAILDTRGPEIRIRSFQTPTVTLSAGAPFTLTTRDVPGDSTLVSVTYPHLHREVAPGQQLLIDDGLVALRVLEVEGQDIRCRVENGGTLSGSKSLNAPGASIRLPSLTEEDIADIRFGAEQNFDYIAASFVRRAEDVLAVRRLLDSCGGQETRIIAKIENQEGADHIDEILACADALMVARGDLGVEIPPERVPFLQKQMIRKGLQAGKPVITATQMLDSMIRNPRPTRAEVSDVANAVFDGTSCVMLSGETANGLYPLEALSSMVRVVTEAEASIRYWNKFLKHRIQPGPNLNDAITHACCLTAMDLNARVILAATHSGHTPRMIARFRPACPVAAFTPSEAARRRLAICWGVIPLSRQEARTTDEIFSLALRAARESGLAATGDTVVITAGIPLGRAGSTNLIKAQILGED